MNEGVDHIRPLAIGPGGFKSLALLALHLPPTTNLVELDHNSTNYVVKIDDDIVRFATDYEHANQLIHEQEILKYVEENTHCTVPHATASGRDPVYMRYHMIPGVTFDKKVWQQMSGKHKSNMINDIAVFLSSLHSLEKPAKYRFEINDRYGPDLIARIKEHLNGSEDFFGGSETKQFFVNTFEQFDSLILPEKDKVLLHQDLHPGNLLVDTKTWRLAGVIDFTLAWWGDFHWDFRKFRKFLSTAETNALIEQYQRRAVRIVDIAKLEVFEKIALCHTFCYTKRRQKNPDSIRRKIENWQPYS